jgi:hypothetical protein
MSLPAWPAVAQEATEYNNEMTMGLRYQSANSALFGRYNGTPSQGTSGIGSVKLDDSDAWNSGKTSYFKAEAENLSADRHQLAPAAAASAETGEQGKWGIKVEYEGIPSYGPH